MNTTPTPESARIARLQTSAARWRAVAIALAAGAIGLGVGGMGQPEREDGFDYVATDNTIYRINERDGTIQYIKVEGGYRTARGYLSWGSINIDESRHADPRPQ